MDDIALFAASLTPEQREGLRPRAKDRRPLLKAKLVHWSTRPGHRFPDLKLNTLGYQVRDHLGLTEPKDQ
jgi:hypothetical protein